MPQTLIPIDRFGGLYTNPHQEDIPDSAASFSLNVDPMALAGTLQGMLNTGAQYTANSVSIPNVYEADWIKYERSNQLLTVSTHSGHPSNPIIITTTAAHNLVSGDKVVIAGVDPAAANGTWRITVLTETTFSIPTATTGNHISGGTVTYTGGFKWDLVYIDKNGNDITAIEDFYNDTTTYRTLSDLVTSGITPKCVKTFNDQVQIGNGINSESNMVYRLLKNKKFFGSQTTVLAGLQSESGQCYNPDIGNGSILVSSVTLTANSSGYFQPNILYKWTVSLVYGNLQESNLNIGYSASNALASSRAYVNLIATGLNDITLLDSRVTGVNIYRAESSDNSASNLGLYRLVKTIDINSGNTLTGTANAAVTTTATTLRDTRLSMVTDFYRGYNVVCDGKVLHVDSNNVDTFTGISWFTSQPASGLAWELSNYGNWFDSGSDYKLAYFDDGRYIDGGATYEGNSGMPEPTTRQSVRYTINEVGGGYHWATNGQVEGEDDVDWQRYIFRSKKFRPNMFDWAREFLVLPRIPTALAWYNNYLYAFSENEIYKIHPELLIIEDTFTGAGCSNRQAVTVTEFGMFFCNVNACYQMHPDGTVETISDAISEDSPIHTTMDGWRTMANFTLNDASSVLDKLMVLYEADKRSVLFFFEGTNIADTLEAFAYFIPTKEWYYWRLGIYNNVTVNTGAFNGKDGEIYVSCDTDLGRLFANTTYTNGSWASKEFHLGKPSQNKSWNMIKWDAVAGTGTVAVTYGTDGTTAIGGTVATSGAWINTYKKTFQIYAALTGNARLDSLDIIVRPLIGDR
jgi:hypothetical protein